MTTIVDCPLCTYAAKHGWWGPGHRGTHCRTCHRSWTSKQAAHCTMCHRHFGGVRGFEMHLQGGGAEPLVCLDPAAILDKDDCLVLEADNTGTWRRSLSPAGVAGS